MKHALYKQVKKMKKFKHNYLFYFRLISTRGHFGVGDLCNGILGGLVAITGNASCECLYHAKHAMYNKRSAF